MFWYVVIWIYTHLFSFNNSSSFALSYEFKNNILKASSTLSYKAGAGNLVYHHDG